MSRWEQLKDVPFKGPFPVVGRATCAANNYIILSSDKSDAKPSLYRYTISTKTWSTHEVNKEYATFAWHAMCLDADRRNLFLFDGYNAQRFMQIDVESMQCVRTFRHKVRTGAYPSIICDPANSKMLHIIGGRLSNEHQVLNLDSHQASTQHTFDGLRAPMDGGRVVLNQRLKALLYFNGASDILAFDLKSRRWAPFLPSNKLELKEFGLVQSPDHKYVVIVNGDHYKNFEDTNGILVLDVESKAMRKINVVSPVSGPSDAVFEEFFHDLHVFWGDVHFKINMNVIIDNFMQLQKGKAEEKAEPLPVAQPDNDEDEAKRPPPENQGVAEVRRWLTEEVKMPQYVDMFIEEGYDAMMQILDDGGLTHDDLEDMGITKKGHRKKIVLCIANKIKQRNQPQVAPNYQQEGPGGGNPGGAGEGEGGGETPGGETPGDSKIAPQGNVVGVGQGVVDTKGKGGNIKNHPNTPFL